jgi:hypothetical protein
MGTTRQQAEQDKLGNDILAFLRANPQSLEADILDGVVGRRKTMVRALRQLIGREVVRTGKGGKADPYRYSYSAEPESEPGTRIRYSPKDLASRGKIVVPNGKRTSGSQNGPETVDPKVAAKASGTGGTRPRAKKSRQIETAGAGLDSLFVLQYEVTVTATSSTVTN